MRRFIHIPSTDQSILDFNPINVWDSENLVIVGDSTTATDYNEVGATYDLSNPTAANQPVYNASDADFNGFPSLTFDGINDYLYRSLANWRGSDTSGFIVNVVKFESTGSLEFFFSSADEATNGEKFAFRANSASSIQSQIVSGSITNTFSPTKINSVDPFVISLGSDSTQYFPYIDNTLQTVGTSTGAWLGGTGGARDNISIGADIKATNVFGNIKWVFTGYFPFVNQSTCEQIITFLLNKYKL